jgi:hypothetical protein
MSTKEKIIKGFTKNIFNRLIDSNQYYLVAVESKFIVLYKKSTKSYLINSSFKFKAKKLEIESTINELVETERLRFVLTISR